MDGDYTGRWRDQLNSRTVLIALAVGLIVRLVLIPFTSSPFDVSAGWVAVIEEIYAGDTLYDGELYKYPPVWGYILATVSAVADMLGMSSFGDPFTNIYLDRELTFGYCFITNPEFNILVKAPALIFDVLAAFAAYDLVLDVSKDRRKAEIGFVMWFLCPIVIMSSAVLCMFDSIMIFFMIETILLFRRRAYALAGITLALSILTKAFSALLLPLMVAYILSDRDSAPATRIKNLSLALAGFLAVTLVMYLPLLLNGEFADSLWFLSSRSGSYSDSGFNPAVLSFNNIFFYLPLIIAVLLGSCVYMALCKHRRDERFLTLSIVSLCIMFSFPFVSYTPTYGIVMLPAFLIYYAMKGNAAWIPWLLLLFFVFHGAAHYWSTAFYPLAAWSDSIDISAWPEHIGNTTVYNFILYCMSSAGFIMLLLVACDYILPRIPQRRSMHG